MPRPARSMSAVRDRASIEATAEPTVPNPARPTLSGSAIRAIREESLRSAAFGKRKHVVQLFRRAFKEASDIAGGLADALLVLDQRDPHIAFAMLAEADAGRNRDRGLLHHQ